MTNYYANCRRRRQFGSKGGFDSCCFKQTLSTPPVETSFLVNLVEGATVGLGQFSTASTFFGSTRIPSLATTCPKNVVESSQNSHLENLAYS